MTAIDPNNPGLFDHRHKDGEGCFVCSQKIRNDQFAIQWSGHLQEGEKESYIHIWFHPECATTMVLQLSSDVMKQRHTSQHETLRVVDSLRNIKNIYAMKD